MATLPLGQRINEEYAKIMENPERSSDVLFTLLNEYIVSAIKENMSFLEYPIANQEIEDVAQECLLKIWNKGMKTYDPTNKAGFASYCWRLAANTTIDYAKRIVRNLHEELEQELIKMENEPEEAENFFNFFSLSPEKVYWKKIYAKDCKNNAKTYLETFMNLKAKPYMLVSAGYSLFLCKKYPTPDNINDLSSVKFAWDSLQNKNVEYGADNFTEEMNSWLGYLQLKWGERFVEDMDKVEDGIAIRNMIYGTHMTHKDMENWNTSIRKKIKDAILEKKATETNIKPVSI